MARTRPLTLLLAATAVVCTGISLRTEHARAVLPELPPAFEGGTSVPLRLSETELRTLGGPKYRAAAYTMPNGVRVEVLVTAIAAGGNVHDSRLCAVHDGFRQTGELPVRLTGRTLSASVLQRGSERVLMTGWYVHGDGSIEPLEPMGRYGAQRWSAVRTMFGSLKSGKQTLMFRLTSPLSADTDEDGKACGAMAQISKTLMR